MHFRGANRPAVLGVLPTRGVSKPGLPGKGLPGKSRGLGVCWSDPILSYPKGSRVFSVPAAVRIVSEREKSPCSVFRPIQALAP